jgi:hypothetical protein
VKVVIGTGVGVGTTGSGVKTGVGVAAVRATKVGVGFGDTKAATMGSGAVVGVSVGTSVGPEVGDGKGAEVGATTESTSLPPPQAAITPTITNAATNAFIYPLTLHSAFIGFNYALVSRSARNRTAIMITMEAATVPPTVKAKGLPYCHARKPAKRAPRGVRA